MKQKAFSNSDQTMTTIKRDFPGGAVDKNPHASTEDTGSISSPEGFRRLWSSWGHVPELLRPRAWSLCSATREATAIRSGSTARESSPACN